MICVHPVEQVSCTPDGKHHCGSCGADWRPDGQPQPRAWMRRWAFDGEQPYKTRKENGRMALAGKFRLLPVTVKQLFSDDVPLYVSGVPGDLPPLPEPHGWIGANDLDPDAGVEGYTVDQMRDYALSARSVSASDSQTCPGIPASSALDSSASGESTSGQVHSGDAPASAPLAGGSVQ